MKTSGILFGALLALALAPAARATDAVVPDPSQPAEQDIDPCSAYGAGFMTLPGTHTCVRVGGTVGYDVNINGKANSHHSRHGGTTLEFESRSE